MSLLTGEPRSATVVADSEVECFRLDKAAVQEIINARPALAEQLAKLLADRKVALQSAKEANALLSRIRSFFALS